MNKSCIADPNWNCQDGKGEDGNSFSQKTTDDLDKCKSECLETHGCIALDYSTTSKNCRLFQQNQVKDNSQGDKRNHCSLGNILIT